MTHGEFEKQVRDLYGIPGDAEDAGPAAELLLETVAELGFDALSDQGIARLAEKHLARHSAASLG